MTSFESISIDAVQAYWDARPCNIRHSAKQIGSREYFDEVEARKYFVEPHIPQFADFAQWRGKRVLEIGCGIGTDTINFARHGALVTAIDISERSVAIARERVKLFGVSESVAFYQANAEQLSTVLPIQHYDLVYSFGVLHHTPEPARMLEEIRNYLALGGKLKLMIYHRHSWKVLSILLTHGRGRFWNIAEIVARHSEAQTGCPVTYTYSRTQARKLVEAQRFWVSELRVDHVFPYRIADYVEYRYVHEPLFRRMPASWFRRLERLFGWHLLITAEAV